MKVFGILTMLIYSLVVIWQYLKSYHKYKNRNINTVAEKGGGGGVGMMLWPPVASPLGSGQDETEARRWSVGSQYTTRHAELRWWTPIPARAAFQADTSQLLLADATTRIPEATPPTSFRYPNY